MRPHRTGHMMGTDLGLTPSFSKGGAAETQHRFSSFFFERIQGLGLLVLPRYVFFVCSRNFCRARQFKAVRRISSPNHARLRFAPSADRRRVFLTFTAFRRHGSYWHRRSSGSTDGKTTRSKEEKLLCAPPATFTADAETTSNSEVVRKGLYQAPNKRSRRYDATWR